MNTPLSTSARVYAELKARLMADEGLQDGEQALTDTLEGATDFAEQVAAVVREARASEAMATGLAAVLRDMTERKVRLEARAARLRSHVLWALQEAGVTKITAPDATIAVQAGRPELQLFSEPHCAPEKYQRVKREWNRTAVRAALESGVTLDFARLGNASPCLNVRSK